MKNSRSTTAVTGSLVALAAVIALAVVSPGLAGGKPLNSGKNGFKSNAGAGNGTEDVQVGEPVTVTTYSSSSTESTTSTSTEPVITPISVTTTEISRVRSDKPDQPSGNSGNFKRYFDVTNQIVTTVGTETVITYETVRVTEVYRIDTTTTDMADVDPGNSQDNNQAPEGQPADIVVVAPPVLETSSSEVSTSQETVNDILTTSSTEVLEDVKVECNGSEGQNQGTDYCS